MSAPLALGIAVTACTMSLVVLAAAQQVEAQHRVSAAADAAALAAADVAGGWARTPVGGEDPCAFAASVVATADANVRHCLEAGDGTVTIEVRGDAPFGAVLGRAKAASPVATALHIPAPGAVGAGGWAWPSGNRALTQGHHDGFAIDLAVAADSALYAPYDGVVVQVGPDGAGPPAACRARPEWWHGPNHTVILRHDVDGRVLFSSHNHVAPQSSSNWGIRPGARVRAGQPVAQAGLSGCTSGAHTHFTLSTRPVNAFPDVDPLRYLGLP